MWHHRMRGHRNAQISRHWEGTAISHERAALDWLNLLLAALQAAFGPFLAVSLADRGWMPSGMCRTASEFAGLLGATRFIAFFAWQCEKAAADSGHLQIHHKIGSIAAIRANQFPD